MRQQTHAYITKLGLSTEIADIYVALYEHGPQSISALSRHAGVERTRIYRLLDELKSSGLVEIEVHNKYSILRAAPIMNSQIIISKKEEELGVLEAELETLHRALDGRSLNSATTRVQFYEGIEGIKQMSWNQTKAESENLAILYETLQLGTAKGFFERWVRAFNAAGVRSRSIVGNHFIEGLRNWRNTQHTERLNTWHARYVPEKVFPITHSMIIYDDVVAYYNWKNDAVFGVEIINQEIADAQRAFFEMLWAQGVDIDGLKTLDRLSPHAQNEEPRQG